MALYHPFLSYTKKPTFSSFKICYMCRINLNKPEYGTAHRNKIPLEVVMKQSIDHSENIKFQDDFEIRHANAMKEVKHILISKVRKNSLESLSVIDMIQRLGIEYHFEEEIQAAIQKQHMMFTTDGHGNGSGNYFFDLSQVALQFRLLRQEGHFVPSDVFNKFMDKKGRIRHQFYGNLDGLLELFEASQLSIVGEYGLDEAGNLSCNLLKEWLSKLGDHSEANIVANALQHPIHRNLSRLMPFHLRKSQARKGRANALQAISRVDSQIVNSMHLEEIFAVSKWWGDLGLAKELKFARNEPIKWYMWPMACLTNPRLSEERIELTKPISLIYVIDDIFDAYGSMDELSLFTEAVNRWDLVAMVKLPDCMKVSFKALYGITNEFAHKVQKKHGCNPINILVKSWARLCNAFMEEARWFSSGQLPSTMEYMKNGLLSTGVRLMFVHIFFLLGEGINKETVALMEDFPTIISSSSTILRLFDDLEGPKDAFYDGSYLKCYMKENSRVSEEETRKHVTEMISNAWKSLNQECLSQSNPFPLTFNKICLNGARIVPLMYGHADGKHCQTRLKEHVRLLLCGGNSLQGVRETPLFSSFTPYSTDCIN